MRAADMDKLWRGLGDWLAGLFVWLLYLAGGVALFGIGAAALRVITAEAVFVIVGGTLLMAFLGYLVERE